MNKAGLRMLALALFAVAALAHGTDAHAVLGTVKAVDEGSLTVTDRNGKDVTIALTDDTVYLRGDSAASRADLAVGMRVSVKLTHDNKSAVTVKMPPVRE